MGPKTIKGKALESKNKDNKTIVKMLVEANKKGLEEAKIERDMMREGVTKKMKKFGTMSDMGGGGDFLFPRELGPSPLNASQVWHLDLCVTLGV